MNISNQKKILFAYLGVVIIWSTTPLAIKWSGQGEHFLYGVTWRMVVGLLCLLLVMLLTKRPLIMNKLYLALYVFSGLFIYLSMMSVYFGAQYIDSSLVALLFALSPLVTGIFSVLWLRQKSFQKNKSIGLFLALVGVVVIFYHSLHISYIAIWGVLSVLVSVVIHAFSGVMFKKYTQNKSIDSLSVTTGALIVCIALYFTTLLFTTGQLLPTQYNTKMLWATLYLGVAGSALGYVLYVYVLHHLQANQVALLTLITPMTAMYLGTVFNHEQLTVNLMAGTFFILAGLLSYNIKGLKFL